nr:aldo/keto reductase [Actinomycetota bacterium]
TTLGHAPEVVFLHNPERALPGADPAAELDRLAAACAALEEVVAAGTCRSWGISSWDPRPMRAVLPDAAAAASIPAPAVLMVRAGLLVTSDVLDAGEHLADVFRLDAGARWGMSPFGGEITRPIWETLDPGAFLAPQQKSTVAQALLRVAFALPAVTRIAVGTDRPAHLDGLIAATGFDVDDTRVAHYRALLREQAVRAVER